MNDKYVAVPREDWEGILDSVRGKTGKTGLLKSGEVKPEIDGIKTGGGSSGGGGTEGYITFYDYDGTIVTSWTKEQLEAATELPENPEHEGLTAQGWNWTLDELKAEGGEMDVGQMYIASDGKTHVFIELEEERREIRVGLAVNGTVEIDFGDGSAPVTLTGTSISTVVYTDDHKYPAAGKYDITYKVIGQAAFYNENTIITKPTSVLENSSYLLTSYLASVYAVRIGPGMIIKNYAFKNSLIEYISVPNNADVLQNASDVFYAALSLRCLIIPRGITRITNRLAMNCHALKVVSMAPGIKGSGYDGFGYCENIKEINMPKSITAIDSYSFEQSSIRRMRLPDEVSSIGTSSFTYCRNLIQIDIPKSILRIESGAMSRCYALKKCRIKSPTPPTLGTNAFQNTPADMMIAVNPGCVDEYVAATNWSAEAAKIYSEHSVSFTWGSGVLRLIDPPEKLYYNSSTPYENIIRAEFDPDYAFDGAYDIHGQGVEITLGGMSDGENGTIIAELHAVITDPDADDFEIYIASM